MIISVIVPCRNEVENITECLDAIFNSELDENDQLEVILVDGLSDDGTVELLEAYQQQDRRLKLIQNKARVTPVAFNLGVLAAKGEFVQIIGARQIISSDYLKKAKATLNENEDIWCVGGAVENVYQTEESKIIGLAMGSTFGVGGGNFRILKESAYTDTVGTPMYKKEVFKNIGLFNESLLRNQDDEFNFRLTKSGGKIYLIADITIKYYVRASIKNLFRQYYQYGYWKVFVNKMHNTITTYRQLFPVVFVVGLILGLITSFLIPFLWFFYVSVVLIYLFCCMNFGIKSGSSFKQGLKIAKIFPVLHLSYGWGYLIAIFKFLIFRKNPIKADAKLSR